MSKTKHVKCWFECNDGHTVAHAVIAETGKPIKLEGCQFPVGADRVPPRAAEWLVDFMNQLTQMEVA